MSQISFHPTQPYLAVQSHDRSVEIFRIRTEEEIRKKQTRRLKRVKEKKQHEGKQQGREKTILDQQEVDEDPSVKLVDRFTPHLVVRATGRIRSFDFGPRDNGLKGGIQVDEQSLVVRPGLNCFHSFLRLCFATR